MSASVFDAIFIGGGLAGSTMAASLADAGFGVLLLEREQQFRDRIRGEAIWPWGVTEVQRLGLHETLMQTGAAELRTLAHFEQREISRSFDWAENAQTGFSHPRFQEALWQRAVRSGVTAVRPAKAISVTNDSNGASVTVVDESGSRDVRARLVVCADGKSSSGRRWTGGTTQSDPVHHRFGGVLLSGIATDRNTLFDATTPEVGTFWFSIGETGHRIYLRLTGDQLRATGANRSLDNFLAVVKPYAPAGTFDGVEQVGPLGFFPNASTWATVIAANGIVLIGDAAGSADPTNGHGLSLVFRDVRELRDLLVSESDWNAAIREFARRRTAYFAAVRAADTWYTVISAEVGSEADLRRERHARAREQDPTLGGFATLEERGPDGLIPDEAARAHYFGEDLA